MEFKFTDKSLDRIERTRILSKRESQRQVILDALVVWESIVEKVCAGDKILVGHPDGSVSEMTF